MQEKLEKWCTNNFLFLTVLKEGFLFDVGNIGKKFFLLPERKKLFIGDLQLALEENEFHIIEEETPDYFVFEFGGCFYYSKLVEKKNDFDEIYFKVQFNELKYLGTANFENYKELPYLHIHSEYELLNGSHKAKDWCKKAKFMQYDSIAIADKNTLAGTLSLQMACKDAGIKSIMGGTYTIAIGYEEGSSAIPETYEMSFYVKNEQGWKNILLLNKYVNVTYDGFIPEEVLLQHGKGLIGIVATGHRLNRIKDVKVGLHLIGTFADKFDSLFYQIDSNEQYDDKTDIKNLENIKFYLKNYRDNLEPLLVNDTYYLDKEMFPLKEMLNKVSRKPQSYSEDQYLKTTDEIYNQLLPMFESGYFDSLYSDCINNAMYIHTECNFIIDTGEHKLPKYKFKEGVDNNDLLFDLIQKGIDKKLSHLSEDEIAVYLERIEKELELIVSAGFVDYFLILWDIIQWAMKNGIMVGTGRGSVGGCLLAYLIDIISVDPVKYDLLFERFMNEIRARREIKVYLELEDGRKIELDGYSTVKTNKGEMLAKDLTEEIDIDV